MDHTPELPPNLKSKSRAIDNSNDLDDYLPELPPHLKEKESAVNYSSYNDECCPQLPPHLQNETSSNHKKDTSESDSSESEDLFCPALPPHLMKNKTYGPTKPPADYIPPVSYKESSSSSSDEEDSQNIYGPMPAAKPVDIDEHIEQIFSDRHKKRQEVIEKKNAPKKLERESWMLELPDDRPITDLGLKPRQFARKAKKERGDTSLWTDTPADKARKAEKNGGRASKSDAVEELITPETIAAKKRDEKLQSLVDNYNAKKRSVPLIDAHGKQKKQKKSEESLSLTGVGIERKPFSREDDMNINKFDEAQKATILKKARQLNDRFSTGKSSKFL